MEFVSYFIDLFLHLDKHLDSFVSNYGAFTYFILFLIIFAETGLVVTPFLPGDSLLFAAGAIAARPDGLDPFLLVVLLLIAAVLGDGVNYLIGKFIGPKVFAREYRFLKKEHLVRTQEFYEKHGGKAIIIARFIPIIRTFAPFIAGVGAMNYSRFVIYNIVGAVAWVVSFVVLGYLVGDNVYVKKNFTLVIFGIIFISVLPAVYQAFASRKHSA
ncbi:MAG TPA: DedA family protein [Cytophagaceae bacterium]|jgi:membrane-associated protein|nr:DedA family protein [Cytophagaceae bacterium]